MKSDVSPVLPPPQTWTEALPGAAGACAGWYTYLRVVAEFIAALVLFVLTAPLVLLTAGLVKLTSRGPALYKQTRLGKNGHPFMLYKVRTMYHDCERKSGAQWSCPGDPRITALGRFLRRTHLDELPQLWNVLRGEMSLVGPRPERPEFVPALIQAIPRYQERLLVRPGVTGLAQICLPADTDLNSVRRKLTYDLYYVENQGPWLDLRIVLATAVKVLGFPLEWLAWMFWMPAVEAIEDAFRSSRRQGVGGEPPPCSETVARGSDRVVGRFTPPLILNPPEGA
jgi:lipopolysaccharide/colanic/teichoic acid biosynthesis glycosyltransferase